MCLHTGGKQNKKNTRKLTRNGNNVWTTVTFLCLFPWHWPASYQSHLWEIPVWNPTTHKHNMAYLTLYHNHIIFHTVNSYLIARNLYQHKIARSTPRGFWKSHHYFLRVGNYGIRYMDKCFAFAIWYKTVGSRN